ncbi:MAG TPA: endonuclease domain-containing protein, partial [Arenimonas sp.]|nr:endonuclease domain-containing protein [Arenimonas sp.]
MTDFEPGAVRAFRFLDCGLDPATGEARLDYAFDDGPVMTEVLRFPGAPFALDGERAGAVQRALRLLHLVAGVSYYKAAVPLEIRIEGYDIDAETAALLTSIYE